MANRSWPGVNLGSNAADIRASGNSRSSQPEALRRCSELYLPRSAPCLCRTIERDRRCAPLYVPITLISGILRGAGEGRAILPRGRIGPHPPLVIVPRA